ncbi:MAG: DUF2141 domain-containing protein [Hyphomicrobiales bacterium]|nr:DUF2141 domain-containing protein [Hyphomicrobiales bacterium]MBV8825499.1 DUF2141 domain-containing protein [Hyphomicrobiales bacterium]MBV9429425.1 DUF2141 domain-containing protein [Bradyrhizobiaceae bacterium]
MWAIGRDSGLVAGIVAAVALVRLSAASAGELKLEFADVLPGQGPVLVAVVPEKHAAAFPTVANRSGVTFLQIDSRKPPFSTTVEVPNGRYAVAAYQDVNSDGVLQTAEPFGIPAEPWGISNNRKPAQRAPNFNDAAFVVGDGINVQVINLGQ